MLTGAFKKIKILIFLLIASLLYNCSSSDDSIDDYDLGPEPLPWAGEGTEILESHVSTKSNQGVLLFFQNSLKGIGVGSMGWGSPIEKYNPGVDCRLVREKLGPPTTLFKCSIEGPGKESVIVEIYEDLKTARRKMNKVSVITADKKAFSRWAQELRLNNYRKLRDLGDKGVSYISSNNRTHATLSLSDGNVLLVFQPAFNF